MLERRMDCGNRAGIDESLGDLQRWSSQRYNGGIADVGVNAASAQRDRHGCYHLCCPFRCSYLQFWSGSTDCGNRAGSLPAAGGRHGVPADLASRRGCWHSCFLVVTDPKRKHGLRQHESMDSGNRAGAASLASTAFEELL